MTISELCKAYDLPGDFLIQVMKATNVANAELVVATFFLYVCNIHGFKLLYKINTKVKSWFSWCICKPYYCFLQSFLLFDTIYLTKEGMLRKAQFFYLQALSRRLGRIIHGQLDQENHGVIFTEAFVSRHRARIRGLFTAITR